MELYEPINTLKPVGEDLWVVDGPIVRMVFLGGTMPFPTRMVVVRLANGALFLWSPTEPNDRLRAEIDALGPVRHLVSPNKIHYAHIAPWKRAYPEVKAWASPGVRERAASQRIDVSFDADLRDLPEEVWSEDLDQLVFRGSRFMEEVVFFHRWTRTLILADLIENFEVEKVGGFHGWLLRLGGAADSDGKAPIDLRLSVLGRKKEARSSYTRMVAWEPEKVIMAHGRWYKQDGTPELHRAFRWLVSKEYRRPQERASVLPRRSLGTLAATVRDRVAGVEDEQRYIVAARQPTDELLHLFSGYLPEPSSGSTRRAFTGSNYLAMLTLAATLLWLRFR